MWSDHLNTATIMPSNRKVPGPGMTSKKDSCKGLRLQLSGNLQQFTPWRRNVYRNTGDLQTWTGQNRPPPFPSSPKSIHVPLCQPNQIDSSYQARNSPRIFQGTPRHIVRHPASSNPSAHLTAPRCAAPPTTEDPLVSHFVSR